MDKFFIYFSSSSSSFVRLFYLFILAKMPITHRLRYQLKQVFTSGRSGEMCTHPTGAIEKPGPRGLSPTMGSNQSVPTHYYPPKHVGWPFFYYYSSSSFSPGSFISILIYLLPLFSSLSLYIFFFLRTLQRIPLE